MHITCIICERTQRICSSSSSISISSTSISCLIEQLYNVHTVEFKKKMWWWKKKSIKCIISHSPVYQRKWFSNISRGSHTCLCLCLCVWLCCGAATLFRCFFLFDSNDHVFIHGATLAAVWEQWEHMYAEKYTKLWTHQIPILYNNCMLFT